MMEDEDFPHHEAPVEDPSDADDPDDALGPDRSAADDGHSAQILDLIRYDVTENAIREMGTKYAALEFGTPEDYRTGVKAIAVLRETRVKVEERRKQLKRNSLEFGRKVDAVAKQLTALLESFEEPLKAKKLLIDDEKARAKREAEAEERRALEEKVRAEREAEESRLADEKAALEVERARLAAEKARQEADIARQRAELEKERKATQARLDAEGERLKAERDAAASKARQELEAIEEQKRAITAERERQERVEFERLAAIRAEQDAKAKAEEDRIAAEEALVREEERKAEHVRRLEALRPDRERILAFAAEIRSLAAPVVKSPEASVALDEAVRELAQLATDLEAFGAESVKAAE